MEFDGLVVVGDGPVVFSFVVVGDPAGGVGPGIVRLEFDGLVVVGDGPVVVPCVGVGVPATVVGHGEVWLEFDGLVVVGDGPVVFPFVVVDVPAVVVGPGDVRLEFDGLVEVGDGPVVFLFAGVGSPSIEIGGSNLALIGLHRAKQVESDVEVRDGFLTAPRSVGSLTNSKQGEPAHRTIGQVVDEHSQLVYVLADDLAFLRLGRGVQLNQGGKVDFDEIIGVAAPENARGTVTFADGASFCLVGGGNIVTNGNPCIEICWQFFFDALGQDSADVKIAGFAFVLELGDDDKVFVFGSRCGERPLWDEIADKVKGWSAGESIVDFSKGEDSTNKGQHSCKEPIAAQGGLPQALQSLPGVSADVLAFLGSKVAVDVTVVGTFPGWVLAAVTVFGFGLALGASGHLPRSSIKLLQSDPRSHGTAPGFGVIGRPCWSARR